MKKTVRNLTLVGCVGSSVFAAPFLAIGDNAELFVTADATAAYNDNILLSSSKKDDTVFTFRPGLDLQFGKDSAIKGNVDASAALTKYYDNGQLDSQLFGVAAATAYDGGGRLSLNTNASYFQSDQPTVDITSSSTLVERDTTSAGVNGEFAFSEKISMGSGFAYTKTDYKDGAGTDAWEYSVPVNVYYELTPKVDVSTGIRYTHTSLDKAIATGANQYDAYYYNVGARGAFTPKLSGSFSVGYNMRHANVAPDDPGSLGADASLSYAYSEKTNFTLGLSRDFKNASIGGASYENSQITLSAVNALTVDWRLNASVTYRLLDYTATSASYTETYVEGSLGATYIINNHLTAGLAYIYREKSSDAASSPSEFKNNVITLSLSARY